MKEKCFFTNIDYDNPYKIWMENLADWTLIERSHDDLINMVNKSIGSDSYTSLRIKKDQTGLTHLTYVTK